MKEMENEGWEESGKLKKDWKKQKNIKKNNRKEEAESEKLGNSRKCICNEKKEMKCQTERKKSIKQK